MPTVDEFEYTFDSLANVAEKVGLKKYSIFLIPFGRPPVYSGPPS
jgi:hypothetical protein